MKVFGYQKNSEILLELEEMSLQCNIIELERVISFLSDVKDKHSNVKDNTNMCHSHFRDWDQSWEKGNPDIIVVTKFDD